MACPVRKFPLNQPDGHEPPIPRWKLQLPEGVDRVFTTYVGVQSHNQDQATLDATQKAISAVNHWVKNPSHSPVLSEDFSVVRGDVKGSITWVAYWVDAETWKASLDALNLPQLYAQLGDARSSVGLWSEAFETPAGRLETNYSGLDYLPGLGKIPGADRQRHKLSAYWGAARDRLPGSGWDAFERVDDSVSAPPDPVPAGLGERLVGINYDNMAHIRSGQFWENTNEEEREAYETLLEPTLLKGLGYLWDTPVESGNCGLRFLRNLAPDGHELRETCGAGFFRCLEDLENWSKHHPTHKAIYTGLMKHQKKFGTTRKLRTWHEVSILKKGEAHFDYVNCQPETGSIRFLKLKKSTIV
ncbi:putative phenylacetaldoxime dehydratase family protein [Rhizodiscina lignyota]|uniref:Phenylacetaldoxime dehydratase family protein n=1 Tax=Rhizodiscina lignyota TaxID=1504668 RepID=A0A9P4MA86_9PEZI|nr:putative phenylacetaldoxime dehydratase family protein [Rhizodiscina lignyota]